MLLVVALLAGGVAQGLVREAYGVAGSGQTAPSNQPPSRRPQPHSSVLLAAAAIERSLKRRNERGFTLIELSIVLVIIGLIVGGVLVGQSLVSAAEVRAQITQIEKYNSAVNTFRSKFNALPGDMRPEVANQYGFTIGTNCSGGQGGRDGNGLIDGWANSGYVVQDAGETGLFWQDLASSAGGNLIEGQFPNGGVTAVQCYSPAPTVTGTMIGGYLPYAKIGHGNFVYVYEYSGANWYGISGVTQIVSNTMFASANLPVTEAYKMDSKIDDGLPTSGNVQATYINNNQTNPVAVPNTTTSGGTSSSCYDTTTGTYSVTVNNGNGGNCALSFKFQ